MANIPAFKLNAVPHKDMAASSKVFNSSEFEYFLFVRVPEYIAKDYELYQVEELQDNGPKSLRDGEWEHDPGRVWYKFKSNILNKNPGHHVYRLLFINTVTDDTTYLFFSYVAQSHQHEKPYIYMKDDGGAENG